MAILEYVPHLDCWRLRKGDRLLGFWHEMPDLDAVNEAARRGPIGIDRFWWGFLTGFGSLEVAILLWMNST